MNENVAPVVIDLNVGFTTVSAPKQQVPELFLCFREHAVRSCSISLVHNGRMSDDMKPPVLFTKRCVRTRCTVISLFPFQNCDKIKLTAMEDRSYPNNFFVFRLTF